MSKESFNENVNKAIHNAKAKIKDDIKEMCSWGIVPQEIHLEKIFKDIEKYIEYKNKIKGKR